MKAVTGWLIIGGVALLCCAADSQENSHAGTVPPQSIFEALEKTQVEVRPPVSYQIVREYRLSGPKDSDSDSEVVSEVNFRPPASKDYTIQRSSGSKRGVQVVRRILEREVASASNQGRTALTRTNYDLTYIGETMLDDQPCYLLGLQPKRKEADLITGRVWIDAHSFVVRHIEGELAKTPSWWLRRVSVKLTFAELGGAWLQTSMEAVADVRVAGPHTLTSRILDYRTANDFASAATSIRLAGKP